MTKYLAACENTAAFVAFQESCQSCSHDQCQSGHECLLEQRMVSFTQFGPRVVTFRNTVSG